MLRDSAVQWSPRTGAKPLRSGGQFALESPFQGHWPQTESLLLSPGENGLSSSGTLSDFTTLLLTLLSKKVPLQFLDPFS